MSGTGKVYLVGSSHGDMLGAVFRRISADLGGGRPTVAVSFAAQPRVTGDSQTRALAQAAFPGGEVRRFSVADEPGAMTHDQARAIVEGADVVFVSGGDPVLAARRLRSAGADAWLKMARARGAACVGLSAGSIALGECWASWRDDDPDGEPDIVPCLGVAPGVVIDCHAEDDDWEELRAVQRRLGAASARLTFAGVGHGSALVVGPDGELGWMGPAKVLDAL